MTSPRSSRLRFAALAPNQAAQIRVLVLSGRIKAVMMVSGL